MIFMIIKKLLKTQNTLWVLRTNFDDVVKKLWNDNLIIELIFLLKKQISITKQ